MSGVEAFGLILGIIPLIISVAEYYQSTSTVLHRWKEYDTEAKWLKDELNCQECIFRNEFDILLSSVTGWNLIESHQRLESGQDLKWVTDDIKANFGNYLGQDNGAAVLTKVAAIKRELEFLKTKVETLRGSFENASITRADMTARKNLFSAAKARLGFSFSGQQFKKRLSDLNEHNNTLQSLLAQVQRMRNTTIKASLSSASSGATRHLQTRRAAMRVYNSLRHACSAHNGHFVYLSLEDFQIQSLNNPLSFGINVGLQPTTDQHDILIEPPIRFVVKSLGSRVKSSTTATFVREDEQDKTELKWTSKRKRKPDPLPIDGQENKKLKREEAVEELFFDDEERCLPKIHRLEIGHGTPRNPEENRISTDLAVNRDFCKQIRQYIQHLPRLDEIGSVDITRYPELRVYSPREPASCQFPLSLSDLFLKRPEDNYGVGLLPYEIIYLAKRAALALFHFHQTPLLAPNWSGENIVFFDTGKSTSWYTQPHLKVNTDSSAEIRPSTSAAVRYIRNPYTFSLGCLLIELANQSPLSDLQEPDDVVDGEDGQGTRFNISSRVSKSMFMELGTDYRAVVRKCINCDFGKDDDLEDPELQAAFERDVISVLERLERKY